MIKKIKARILQLTKDDMQWCSAMVIWAKLVDEKTGDEYRVSWAKCPSVIGINGTWRSRAQDVFEAVWQKSEVDDEVWLYHAEDENFSYFEPL